MYISVLCKYGTSKMDVFAGGQRSWTHETLYPILQHARLAAGYALHTSYINCLLGHMHNDTQPYMAIGWSEIS